MQWSSALFFLASAILIIASSADARAPARNDWPTAFIQNRRAAMHNNIISRLNISDWSPRNLRHLVRIPTGQHVDSKSGNDTVHPTRVEPRGEILVVSPRDENSTDTHVVPKVVQPHGERLVVSPRDENSTDRPPHVVPKASIACGQTTLLTPGTPVIIKSKNFPNKYPKGENCEWNFEAPGCAISMSCDTFVVRRSKYCKKSSVLVKAGDYEKKLCGNKSGYNKIFESENLLVHFVSHERQRRAKGFKCSILATECTTSSTTTSSTSSTTTSSTSSTTTSSTSSTTTSSTSSTTTVSTEGTDTTTPGDTDCLSCGTVNRANRIVGGIETEVNEYPWQVTLMVSGYDYYFCGGVVFNEKYVITAAHCAEFMQEYDTNYDYEVVFGAHNIVVDNPEPTRIPVAGIKIHPDYDNYTLYNDIALLELEWAVPLDENIKPACIPDPSNDYSGMNAVVTGWGTTEYQGDSSDVLLETMIPIITNEECSNVYGAIPDNMLCAGLPEGGKDACQGDSGGPLVVEDGDRWVLVGIVSWGYGCAWAGYPGVYSRFSESIEWVKSETSEGSWLCNGEGQTTQSSASTVKTSEVTSPTTSTTTSPTTGGESDCTCGVANPMTRIVGGQVTEVNQYPWQVALVKTEGSNPYCGGSILSDTWILTAAHCAGGAVGHLVIIGEHNWNIDTETSSTEVRNIVQAYSHPQYNPNTLDHDIAILQLDEPIIFSSDNKVAPVCLPTNKNYDDVEAVVSGWGTLSSGGSQPYELNAVPVWTMSNAKCRETNYDDSDITDNMICAGEKGKDSCQGDSGGPLVTKDGDNYFSQIGVVSWGYGCGDDGYPGVYARVSNYADDIKEFIANTKTCSPPA